MIFGCLRAGKLLHRVCNSLKFFFAPAGAALYNGVLQPESLSQRLPSHKRYNVSGGKELVCHTFPIRRKSCMKCSP